MKHVKHYFPPMTEDQNTLRPNTISFSSSSHDSLSTHPLHGVLLPPTPFVYTHAHAARIFNHLLIPRIYNYMCLSMYIRPQWIGIQGSVWFVYKYVYASICKSVSPLTIEEQNYPPLRLLNSPLLLFSSEDIYVNKSKHENKQTFRERSYKIHFCYYAFISLTCCKEM